MERLLDFSKPVDIQLFEETVRALNESSDGQLRAKANQVLTAMRESEDAWKSTATLLEQASSMPAKFMALSILEETIKFRWRALPKDQQQGIRNYVVGKIIEFSGNEQMMRDRNVRVFLNKLNLLLVQILKQEWPHNWPDFIPEIVSSSSKSEILCENNMHILKLLSEEIFDFSKDQMTTDKVMTMKTQLNAEFEKIFQLCQLVLSQSTRPGLVSITLQTLLRFIAWIPFDYIFKTDLVKHLATKFLLTPAFRNDTLACLTEISYFEQPQYDHVFRNIFIGVMNLLETQLPPDTDIPKEYEDAGDDERNFIRGLSIFLCTFLTKHMPLMEDPANHTMLITSMFYLVSISMVEDDDVFKICLEFWNQFSRSLYNSSRSVNQDQRLNLYNTVLSRVRSVMISKMAKPEEVLIVEGDDGSIVRETTKDTDAIAQYKTMRDTLVFLTHLDPEDTANLMLEKLEQQCNDALGLFSWHNLNTLSWAIGSISGTMREEVEKGFLVTVIKQLLGLVEQKRGKDNKAVVASNIMYVVGQYPRFLHVHWKFLRTVVYKLFEFMHESHPGVQDMACDTFLKISQKCKSQFVKLQEGEQTPFIDELLQNMVLTMKDLSPHQRHAFYEAVGYMVREQLNENTRNNLLERLMNPSTMQWKLLMEMAQQNPHNLKEQRNLEVINDILRVNSAVCRSMGYTFRPQMMTIYLDILRVYRFFSESISQGVSEKGEVWLQYKDIKIMRVGRVEILKLIETFIGSAENAMDVGTTFCPPLVEPILDDYKSSVPLARNYDVLVLFTTIVNKLGDDTCATMDGMFVEKTLGPLFDSTLSMITNDFQSFPEHRLHFYKLLKAINCYCFVRLFSMPAETQKNIVNALIWGFKHSERTISETALVTVEKMLQNLQTAPEEVTQNFFTQFYLPLLEDVLYVLTDRLHKSSFNYHASILQVLFRFVYQGKVKVPLAPNISSNQQFLQDYVSRRIVQAFPNVGAKVAADFVSGMFDPQKDFTLFKTHVRDFLIRLREFSAEEDVQQLFAGDQAEEQRVKQLEMLRLRANIPGLITEQEKSEMADL